MYIYRLKTAISTSLRNSKLSNSTFVIQNFTSSILPVEEYIATVSTTRPHVRATSLLYAPYNILIENQKPSLFMKCSLGFLCHVFTNNTTWLPACCDGLSTTLFDHISKELDFTYDLYITKDGKYGGFNENGKWNGMINELLQNRADIAVCALEPTNERAKVLKFTPAFDYSYLVFVRPVVKRTLPFMNWHFLRSIEWELAIAIIVSTAATIITLSFIENSQSLVNFKYRFPLREIMTYVFGLIFQRDLGGKNPINWSGRLTSLAYSMAMMIVMSTYTAYIAANSISNNGLDDFEGLSDKKVLYSKKNVYNWESFF